MSRATNRFLTSIAAAALLATGLAASGCASTSKAAAREAAPFLGAWTSDLDDATLAFEATGIFSIDLPARKTSPATSVVGRWSFDPEAKSVTLANLGGSTVCAEVPGEYQVEVVRDTVRFTKVKDNCPAREEHMAWGWKKAEAQGARKP